MIAFTHLRAGETVQLVKVPTIKSIDLSLILETHVVEGETLLLQASSLPSSCVLWDNAPSPVSSKLQCEKFKTLLP